MNEWNAESDISLCESLEAQTQCYADGIKIAQELEGRFAKAESAEQLLKELQVIVQRVAQIEDQARHVRQQWQDTKPQPSPRLKQATEAIRHTLEQLLDKVTFAEGAAAAAKDRLAPQLNAQARGLQMRQAYASVAGQHSS